MGFLRLISSLFMVVTSLRVRVSASYQVLKDDLCFRAIGVPSIVENLGSNAVLERLVIFAYRKIDTNELITVVPPGKFQNCIQDYAESLDTEVYNTDSIVIKNIFAESRNKVIRFMQAVDASNIFSNNAGDNDSNGRPWDIIECPHCVPNVDEKPNIDGGVVNPTINDPLTITDGIDTMAFDKVVSDWSAPHSSNDQYFGPEISSVQDIFSPAHTLNQPENTETEMLLQIDGEQDESPPIHIPNQIDDALQKQEIHKPFVFIPGDLTVDDFHPDRETIENTPLYESKPAPEESDVIYYPPVETWGHVDSERPLYKPPSTKHLHKVLPQLVTPMKHGLPGPSHLSPPSWQIPNIPVGPTQNPADKYSWTYKFPNVNFPMNQGKHMKSFWPIQVPYKPSTPDLSTASDTFDGWLLAQLDHLKISGSPMSVGSLDVNKVRKEIEDALRANGFRVTAEGRLVDANGVASSVSNLKLRPVFIGKSFPYNSLLTGVHKGGNYMRPPTPLIEGLLLSLIDPAMIIGMVTLGVTSLPHKVHVDDKRVQLLSEGNFKNYQNSLPSVIKVRPSFIPAYQLRNSDPQEPRGSKMDREPVPLTLTGEDGQEEASSTPANEEDLGFKIIGGSSAMGTGIPLAIKGRSGMSI